MKNSESTQMLPPKQIEILKLLMEKPIKQNELGQKLKITPPALLYHIDKMENTGLIVKRTLYTIGNAKVNEISINPTALQQIRKILGMKATKLTLITGYGSLDVGYRLPDKALALLQDQYLVDRIVCFTSKDAESIRAKKTKEENLKSIDRSFCYDYSEYRFLESSFYKTVESVLSEELQTSDVLIDLTPLSKLYSFKMLEIANRYNLPCFYIGSDENNNDILLWMSNMKIIGEIEK
jgi:hypothetical protein